MTQIAPYRERRVIIDVLALKLLTKVLPGKIRWIYDCHHVLRVEPITFIAKLLRQKSFFRMVPLVTI